MWKAGSRRVTVTKIDRGVKNDIAQGNSVISELDKRNLCSILLETRLRLIQYC